MSYPSYTLVNVQNWMRNNPEFHLTIQVRATNDGSSDIFDVHVHKDLDVEPMDTITETSLDDALDVVTRRYR